MVVFNLANNQEHKPHARAEQLTRLCYTVYSTRLFNVTELKDRGAYLFHLKEGSGPTTSHKR